MANRGGAYVARGGRGAFFAAKYGGKGRTENFVEQHLSTPFTGPSTNRSGSALGRIAGDRDRLMKELQRVDGRSYGAYRSIEGIDHGKTRD
jgi:hypothetical protein